MQVVDTKSEKIDRSFAAEVNRHSGENVFLCYQCRKCASGCPVRDVMKGSPTELMRQVQLGMKDRAMNDDTIWLCVSCMTCSTRCPQDIDIAHVINSVKMMAQEENVKTDTKNVVSFAKIWMWLLKYMGRIYELGLVGGLNLAMKKPLQGAGLALRMVRKGKLKFLPTIKRSAEMRRMFSRAQDLKK